jgi:NADPH:quinone reductase-like Zn-dependent oxidoreductase
MKAIVQERLMGIGVGLTRPKARVAGIDAAGRVKAVGANVRDLRPGDEVLGFCPGVFAEYARTPADQVVPKPASLTFEQAAAIPMAAATALRGIRDVGGVRPGHRVLVNGAAGGVGTYAVQIAAALGAEVTGVCSTRNVGLVRSLGAAHVVDYTMKGFADGRTRYDVILDNVGNRPLRRLRPALTPAGTLLLNSGGSPGGVFGAIGPLLRAAVVNGFVRQRLRKVPTVQKQENLLALTGLIEAGKAHAGPRPHLPAGRHGRVPAPRGAGTRPRQDRGDHCVRTACETWTVSSKAMTTTGGRRCPEISPARSTLTSAVLTGCLSEAP